MKISLKIRELNYLGDCLLLWNITLLSILLIYKMYWEETLLEMSATMRYGYGNNPTVVPEVGNNHAFQNSYNVKYNFRITFVQSVRFNLVRIACRRRAKRNDICWCWKWFAAPQAIFLNPGHQNFGSDGFFNSFFAPAAAEQPHFFTFQNISVSILPKNLTFLKKVVISPPCSQICQNKGGNNPRGGNNLSVHIRAEYPPP